MSINLSRIKIDTTLERRILIGMIVSDQFLRTIQIMYKKEFWNGSPAGVVADWCMVYWAQYEKAPGIHIRDIFDSHMSEETIDEPTGKYVDSLLSNLSEEYQKIEDYNLNVDYLIDQTERFFRKRSLELVSKGITSRLSVDDVEGGENVISTYNTIRKTEGGWINPFSNESITEVCESIEEKPLFRLRKALGELFEDQLCRDAFIGIMAPEKRGKCLAGSQRVLMGDGSYLPISEIVISGRKDIVSFDEDKQRFRVDHIQGVSCNGVKSVYELHTRTGRRVKCTSNHRFLTSDGWKELREVKEGDFVAVPKKVPIFGLGGMEDYKLKILAYLITDGCLAGRGVSFTSADKAIQVDFEECINEMGCSVLWRGIDGYVRNSESNRGKHDKNFVREMLYSFGLMGKLSYHKYIPDIVFTLSKRKISLFLRVLFSCDGWVSKGEIGYCSVNEVLVRQVQHLLIRFGIVSILHWQENDKAGAWTLSISSYENIKKFVDDIGFLFSKQEKAEIVLRGMNTSHRSFLDKFPWQVAEKIIHEVRIELGDGKRIEKGRLSTPSLLWRKFRKIGAVQEQISKRCPIMRQSFSEIHDTVTGRKFLHSEILWDQVTLVESKGEEETYDISVFSNSNFIAEDIVVHNSFILLELVMRAYRERCNVVLFEVGDMSKKQVLRRIQSYICNNKLRRKPYTANLPHFFYDPDPGKYFIGSEQSEIVPLSRSEIKKEIDSWIRGTGSKELRVSCHENSSVNVKDIRRILDEWEKGSGFVPDVIVVDYADILAPEDNRKDFRHQQNDTWRALRALSQNKHCCVITATQADAGSYGMDSISLKNFSEDKRKYGHVTAMYALNQTSSEKTQGVLRVMPLLVREGRVDSARQVAVLQSLDLGRPYLDSVWNDELERKK